MSERTSAETYLEYISVQPDANGEYTVPANSGSWTKLCDITNYPDVMAPPAKLDSTTLSNLSHTYEKDIKDTNDLTFEANYSMAKYNTLAGMRNTVNAYRLIFGEYKKDKFFGAWSWVGTLDVTPNGAGVSEIRHMTISMFPKTDIKEDMANPAS